jgi:hypothetical protein
MIPNHPARVGHQIIRNRVETKIYIFAFSWKLIFAFRKNMLTKINKYYEIFSENQKCKTDYITEM